MLEEPDGESIHIEMELSFFNSKKPVEHILMSPGLNMSEWQSPASNIMCFKSNAMNSSLIWDVMSSDDPLTMSTRNYYRILSRAETIRKLDSTLQ